MDCAFEDDGAGCGGDGADHAGLLRRGGVDGKDGGVRHVVGMGGGEE